MKTKKRPERTCIVCRTKKDKQDLIRIVRDNNNHFFYDPTGKANGRGAYICKDQTCIEKFLKKNFIERAFKQKVDSRTIEAIKAEIEDLI